MKRILNLACSLVAVLGFTASMARNADAGIVSIFGSNNTTDIVNFLNANGHTATAYASITAANLAGADAAILLRTNGNTDLTNFVQNGGTLITEWTGADWAVNTANFFGAQISGGGFVGTATPVTVTAAGQSLGLANGLSANPFTSPGEGTEFFRDFSSIGSGTVLTTRPGDIPVMIGGSVGAGYAFVSGRDWADSFGTGATDTGQLLLNELAPRNVAVPEPASLAVFGVGALGLVAGGVRRRRKQAAC